MGVATACAPDGVGPPNPTRRLVDLVDVLGQPLSQGRVFGVFRGIMMLLVTCPSQLETIIETI